ncbi:MAG TPA: tRNA pseudouridine(38-40) synthase TruA [Steroidobacteraceae bacterium]
MRRRIAVGIEYEGSAYCGWQVQNAAPSVQAALETALSRVADESIGIICAGRTDAGVHARAQVAHFDTAAARSAHAWLLGANTYLPRDISLRWVRAVPDHFHARYSALARTYRYLILNRAARSALAAGRALLVHQPLDIAAMEQGARWLLGEHDFSAFRSSECQAHSPVRQVRALQLRRSGDWISIDVTANAFLHHMVRNIVGLLLAIGQGRSPPERARQQLQSRSRCLGEATAAALGLYLWRVEYPAAFGLPEFGLPADSAMIDAAVGRGD